MLTVVTVNLNNARGLAQTLASIEKYAGGAEVIVVDGSSTDGSLDLVKTYARAKWIIGEDDGIYDAMNIGAQAAQGDFILFLNSGDKLIETVPLLDLKRGVNVFQATVGGKDRIFRPSSARLALISGNRICHQAVFYSSYLFDRFHYDVRYSIAADYEHLCRCFANGSEFHFYSLVISDMEPSGISERHLRESVRQATAIAFRYFGPQAAFGVARLHLYWLYKALTRRAFRWN